MLYAFCGNNIREVTDHCDVEERNLRKKFNNLFVYFLAWLLL